MSKNVIWTPQPKQAIFLSRWEDEVLFGGSAGGGKSDAMVIEPLRQVHIPHFKALIVRKTFPELSELIDKSRLYYTRAFPRARYNSTSHTWHFPSGAKIRFGSLTSGVTQYQGQAFDEILIDELTHLTFQEYDYLRSRNRPNGPGTDVHMRCTANPGGVGHGFVKARWQIGQIEPMTTIHEDVVWTENGQERHKDMTRIFVPSSVWDNKALIENDPGYVARLASLNEADRNALLYGDWNSWTGQCFTEFKNLSAHYEDRQWTHVINPFKIPDHWQIWCGYDHGYSRPFAVIWAAVAPEERRGAGSRMYIIKEYYGCTGTPNEGVKMEPARIAEEIKRIEDADPNLHGKRILRVGDPAIWGTQTGESVGTMMERQRVYFEKGDNNRLQGKMQIHHRLAFDDDGIPMLYFFRDCRHMIRTLPELVYDERAGHPEDIDTNGEDHLYDALRYLAQRFPVTPPLKQIEPVKAFDPLSNDTAMRLDKYDFYRRF